MSDSLTIFVTVTIPSLPGFRIDLLMKPLLVGLTREMSPCLSSCSLLFVHNTVPVHCNFLSTQAKDTFVCKCQECTQAS